LITYGVTIGCIKLEDKYEENQLGQGDNHLILRHFYIYLYHHAFLGVTVVLINASDKSQLST